MLISPYPPPMPPAVPQNEVVATRDGLIYNKCKDLFTKVASNYSITESTIFTYSESWGYIFRAHFRMKVENQFSSTFLFRCWADSGFNSHISVIKADEAR